MARPRHQPQFDPYSILAALERQRTTYVVVGALARVIHGADEITRGIDITPSARPENLRRLDLALAEMNARHPDGRDPAVQAVDFGAEPVLALQSDYGELKVVPLPEGTRGYEDLRRAATREPIGRGLRPSIASPADLARMLSALAREQDIPRLHAMRRLIELDRGWTLER
jgi:hypothetical protein